MIKKSIDDVQNLNIFILKTINRNKRMYAGKNAARQAEMARRAEQGQEKQEQKKQEQKKQEIEWHEEQEIAHQEDQEE